MRLSDLTADNIRNTKIHVKNEHESRAFQERVFELGVEWHRDGQDVVYVGRPYLFVDGYGIISSDHRDSAFARQDRQDLKIDFTNKPSWADAPDWAQWLAQDANGIWCWHKDEPPKDNNGWVGRVDGLKILQFNGIPNPNWRDTLEQRPDHIPDAKKMTGHIADERKMVSSCQNGNNSQVGGSHYQHLKMQPIEFILANSLDFATGNVIKYVTRAPHKGGVEDLRKAKHYIDILIQEQLRE